MVAITAFPTAIAAPSRRPAPSGRPDLQVVPARQCARPGTGVVGRMVLAALLAVVGVVAVAHLVLADPLPEAGAIPVTDGGHVVAPGETMWSIATEVAPAGEAAAYVERLVEVNGSARVVPGEVILLPAP